MDEPENEGALNRQAAPRSLGEMENGWERGCRKSLSAHPGPVPGLAWNDGMIVELKSKEISSE